MSDIERVMEGQIEGLTRRINALEAENKAMQTLLATPDAAASDIPEVDGTLAGDTAGIKTKNGGLILSAAQGKTLQLAPVVHIGKFRNVEQTLSRHASDQVLCLSKVAFLEEELATLKKRVAALGDDR